ncbi:patatin-like phospholipase family protein [Thalassobacillus pellis]|uniref:patatin-like phospholipase family protein n=1 Tax=Thalassobacillus pellis TaxID=748008 RepID=UPI0019604ECD|nr:patatin-like phospholipase family protein [Thalassobacillus pellis]MBM7552319.1 NTE family protein [Thalassobacillus pellis]
MKIDGVFSGGGVKALAFVGALQAVENKGYSFKRVAGTSAGAITASLLAAGYKLDELEQVLRQLDFETFVDPPMLDRILPFSKWLLLYIRMGLYKGERLERWLYDQLAAKGVYTFRDLPHGSLKVICSDLTLGRILVIPDDLESYYNIDPDRFPVAKAVRMSAGLPYFFMPVKIQGKFSMKSLIVDGGLLSNFPVWALEKRDGIRIRPILGMKLSNPPSHFPKRKITNSIEMFHALFSTMKQAHDARYISKAKRADIIFIPVTSVDTTDFKLTDLQKEQLIDLGREHAEKFLGHWRK